MEVSRDLLASRCCGVVLWCADAADRARVKWPHPACRHLESCRLGEAKSHGEVDKESMEGFEDVHRQVHARYWRWCWPENVSLLLWVQDSP